MERDRPGCGRRVPSVWDDDGRSCWQKSTDFGRLGLSPQSRFRDLISETRTVVDRWIGVLACYTSPQEACVTTLRSRLLKQTERILYCARPVSDSRGRRLGNGAGR